MLEMKDDPRHPRTDLNTIAMYCAVWPRTVYKDGIPTPKMIGSGWRSDQADTAALAIRQNGHLLRGYFGGTV
jgi:hypothetical protein